MHLQIKDIPVEDVITAVQPLMNAMVSCVMKEKGRVDLLGCSLLSYQPGIVKSLETLYGINFAASDNKTGNLASGGDWVLESDGVNVIDTYFVREKLSKFKLTLNFWKDLGNFVRKVPLAGEVESWFSKESWREKAFNKLIRCVVVAGIALAVIAAIVAPPAGVAVTVIAGFLAACDWDGLKDSIFSKMNEKGCHTVYCGLHAVSWWA